MADWKFYIETYGCRVNQYESEKLRFAWIEQGGVETGNPEHADYILINSCAITGRAERNARNAVYRLRQRGPEAKIILTGCAAQFYFDFRPRKNAHWAAPDICVPQFDKTKLLALPCAHKADRVPVAASRSRPILKLQDGCSHGCSYCIVPQTRGRPVSRPPEEILAEARTLAGIGYGELVLSGINLRQYHSEGDFWSLLAWLDRRLYEDFGQNLRLRISSLDPAMLDSRALAVLAQTKLLAPHLHLSIQHASSNVLARMKRAHYTPESILKRIGELDTLWPIMGLGADFLVGFPGETEADLQILEQFIHAMPLSYAHVFPYSRRQGTPAAAMTGHIVKSEKERRALRIRELLADKKSHFLEQQLAVKDMQVVFEQSEDAGWVKGVNQYYTQCAIKSPMRLAGGLIQAKPVQIRNGLIEVTLSES